MNTGNIQVIDMSVPIRVQKENPLESLPAIPAQVIGKLMEEFKEHITQQLNEFNLKCKECINAIPKVVELEVQRQRTRDKEFLRKWILRISTIVPGNFIYAIFVLLS